MTVKNAYPLPLILDIVNKVSEAKAQYFTKLDICWGYNNLWIKEGYKWKATFQMNRGLFEPLVMFFDLTNSLALFQTMMNNIFKDLIDEGVMTIYMDNILIFGGWMKEQHHTIIVKVLDILWKHRLYLTAEKCTFEQPKVKYLSLILSEGCIEMDLVKVAGIQDWPTPKNVTEFQSFVGFVNFYRHFIQDFSHVTKPLYRLTKKGEVWRWAEEEQRSFKELKWFIMSTPILVQPNQEAPFRLETNPLEYATGAVLSQLSEDGKWHPMGFTSKGLNSAERNYVIHYKELLLVIRVLAEWRHILEGTKHTIEILNDDGNLMYFWTSQDLNRQLACWSLWLARFNFHLVHRPGWHSMKPNALSHQADHQVGDEDNQYQVMLPAKRF